MDKDESFLQGLRNDIEYAAATKLITALFVAGARKKGGRATHQFGVGGRGEVRVLDDLALPAHEVWRPGRRFDVVLRHANLNNEDDLSADYRGASLKLSDADGHVVDILLNTGETTVWCNVEMFAERLQLTLRKRLPEFYERHPDALVRYWAGLRRAPTGYDSLAYYSKLSGMYVATDGSRYACRYRLVPSTYAGADTGLPTQRDFDQGVTFSERWPEEERPIDQLRRDYARKLAAGSIDYVLQIAVRPAVDDFGDPMYDACRAWDPDQFAWVDLAEVHIHAPIKHAQLEPLRFSIAAAPDSLGVFPAESTADYTSLGDLRASLYHHAAEARPDTVSSGPLLIAHRGMPGRFQNSRRGVSRALAAGYPGLEIDVVLTADGVPMLSHDPWLHEELVTDLGGQPLSERHLIKDLNWADIEQQFLVGGRPTAESPEPAESPMCLDELLVLLRDYPDVLLFVDVKIEDPEAAMTRSAEAYADSLFSRLRAAALPNPIWVEAPTPQMAATYREHAVDLDVKVALSFPRYKCDDKKPEIAVNTVRAAIGDPVEAAVAAGTHGFVSPWMLVQSHEARAAAKRGLTCILFDVDKPKELDLRDEWPNTMLIVDHWDGALG